MKEILLCKYGELVLKGLNKGYFEAVLLRQFRTRLKAAGNFGVTHAQSTIYVEPLDDAADIEEACSVCQKIFGIVAVSRACVVEKDIRKIEEAAAAYIPPFLSNARSFKAESRRADKRFPLTSPEISKRVGEAVGLACPSLTVDVQHPDIVVTTEIRENGAYLHAGSFPGAGGMPSGSAGRGMLLLSGGIDSPVAGFMMAKRGLTVDAVHFESYPYTSEQAREKVLALAKLVTAYTGSMRVHVISVTHLQEVLRDTCNEEYFTLLLRRSMMRLAERTAAAQGAAALITGESLGQVASQTLEALRVTDSVVNMPVFRPCIGMDKEEIIRIARRINTFETSILPYEDCCTVFTPKHPKTKPVPEKVLEEEAKYDYRALEEEAFSTLQTHRIEYYI